MNYKQLFGGMLLLVFFFVPSLAFALVNINTASVEEFVSADLYRITADQAEKIVAYRADHQPRPFSVIEDIMKVSGIKEGTFERIKASITVGESTSDPVAQDDDDSLATATTSSSGSSSHSSPAGVSDFDEEESVLLVSAGRDRLVTTGSNILFRAVAKGLKDNGNNADFYWNFGDGVAARAQGLYHTYRYAGTYNVVLTLTQNGKEAVSRLVVKVVDPKVELRSKISALGESVVELKNLANDEVNLGEWRLASGADKLVLPADTIIARGASLNLPLVTSGGVELVAPSGQVFVRHHQPSQDFGPDWEKLRVGLERLAPIANYSQSAALSLVEMPAVVSLSQSGSIVVATSSTIELPVRRGWWSRLISKIF